MAVIVSILGVLAVAIGLTGVAQPKRLVDLIEHWQGPTRFWAAVLGRFVLGVVLLAVAPSCRLPVLVRVVGVIAIVAAVIILALGQQRLDRFIGWWLRRPSLIRISAVFAIAFGVLLIYAGA